MRTIKLMADYECFPLWVADPGEVGNIDPADLPISPALQERLNGWAEIYDATLNRDDPIESGFSSDAAEARFRQAGQALAEALRGELGAGWTVIERF